ncbi:unnamed protein product [Cylicocyclus nassatus]|uniref:Uncharacterized protein n=1 Tax=Cylicocyclus nassatus TaxID=53992 RepID=A0AA36H599_CYLNA|nr:unnamed protein product [Cylicocyclus nassatus]
MWRLGGNSNTKTQVQRKLEVCFMRCWMRSTRDRVRDRRPEERICSQQKGRNAHLLKTGAGFWGSPGGTNSASKHHYPFVELV